MKKFGFFLEQLNYYAKNGAITAQTFKEAAQGTGDVSDIIPDILSLAQVLYKIPATELPEHAELSAEIQAHKRRQEKIDNLSYLGNKFTELAEKSPAMEAGEFKKALADLLAEATALASSASASDTRNRFYTWEALMNQCKNYDPENDFTPSMLAGLRFPNGTISYIGARPGGGKSALMVNLAREALDAGRNVFLVNLEMVSRAIVINFCLSVMYSTATEKQRRDLNAISEPMRRFYRLFKNEDDSRETFDKLRRQAMGKTEQLLNSRLFIYDGSSASLETTIADIETKVIPGDVVLIDYIQRMKPPRGNNDQRYIQVKLSSNALLSLALKKEVTVISGAQFGRDKGKDEAAMEDFRESGDIEQDAHNALAIETIGDSADGDRYIHVLKQREGGAKYTRQKLDCRFPYLYIAGIDEPYTLPRKIENKSKNTPSIPNAFIASDGTEYPPKPKTFKGTDAEYEKIMIERMGYPL